MRLEAIRKITTISCRCLVTDDIYARSVAEELLVCRFCIILLCFKDLIAESLAAINVRDVGNSWFATGVRPVPIYG